MKTQTIIKRVSIPPNTSAGMQLGATLHAGQVGIVTNPVASGPGGSELLVMMPIANAQMAQKLAAYQMATLSRPFVAVVGFRLFDAAPTVEPTVSSSAAATPPNDPSPPIAL